MEVLANYLSRKPGVFVLIWIHSACLKITNILWFQNPILEQFFKKHVFPLRYNSDSLKIKVVISGNVLLCKDIKISSGLLILQVRVKMFLQDA